jgi:hypothetical protein
VNHAVRGRQAAKARAARVSFQDFELEPHP